MPRRKSSFDPEWFDKVTLNTREGAPGFIGVHVLKSGQSCRYFEMPIEDMTTPYLWERIMARARVEWQSPDVLGEGCPECGSEKRLFLRRYKGRAFCSFCGAHV